MAQLAIIIFFGLFALAEIYQSVKDVELPMPVYLALGIVLAVVSNLRSINQGGKESIAEPKPSPLQDQD